MMELVKCRNLVKLVAVVAVFGYPAASLAASGTFEKNVAIDGAAIVDVSNESGTVVVRGGDVDEVTIHARIKIDEKLSKSNPARAEQIIRAIKRAPPVNAKGNRIVISVVKRRSYQRYASISYEIIVPRDSDVNVHSVSGNVQVSGVTGEVNAKSESGKVTLADSSPRKKVAAPSA